VSTRQHGSATVIVAALVAAVLAGTALVARMGAAGVATARADALAAVVALSAAHARQRADPGQAPCETAAAVARQNGGRLLDCAVAPLYVEVKVVIPVAGVLGLAGRSTVAIAAAEINADQFA